MQVRYPGTTAWARAITDVLDSWCIFDFDTNSFSSVDESEVKSVQITGGPAVREGGPGPTVAYVFVFPSITIICQLYKVTLSDQAQVTLQRRVSFSDLV
jgi:hypothetical protein